MNQKKRKKKRHLLRRIILLLVLLLIAGIFVISRVRPQWLEGLPWPGRADRSDVAGDQVETAQAAYGTIRITTEGNGTVEPAATHTVVSEYTVEIASVEAENGDIVAQGDLIATIDVSSVEDRMDEIRDAVSTLNSRISAMDKSGASSVTAPVSGRVKRVFVSEGDVLADAVRTYGGVMELSADRKLKVVFDSVTELAVGQSVTVTVHDEDVSDPDREGTVQSADGYTYTVTLEDASELDVDTAATVKDAQGSELGEGILASNAPYLVDAQYGVCDDVNVSVGNYVESGAVLLYRTDYTYNADYTDAVQQREEKLTQLRALQDMKDDPRILAAKSGILSDLMLADRQPVQKDAPMYTVIDTGTYWLKAQIDELDIAGVLKGQEVSVVFDAFEEEVYPGVVKKVSAIGSNTGGVTTYPVTIELEGDEKVKLGMSATATITIQEKEHALLIPVDAVQTEDGGHVVTVADGDDYTKVPVTLGLVNHIEAEILEGIDEGQQVVVYTDTSANDWISQMMQRNQRGRE